MTDTPSSKAQLRSMLRQRRQAISPSAQLSAAQALGRTVSELPAWQRARRIAMYMAADGEIDIHPLANQARGLDKQLFLPVLNADQRLDFACWEQGGVMTRNRYDIPEPAAGSAVCPPSELDIIFLPLVGWDSHGGRLGMGGGFYDRTLAGINGPLLVGLAHECQQVVEVPRDSWDVVLHYVATDVALYRSTFD